MPFQKITCIERKFKSKILHEKVKILICNKVFHILVNSTQIPQWQTFFKANLLCLKSSQHWDVQEQSVFTDSQMTRQENIPQPAASPSSSTRVTATFFRSQPFQTTLRKILSHPTSGSLNWEPAQLLTPADCWSAAAGERAWERQTLFAKKGTAQVRLCEARLEQISNLCLGRCCLAVVRRDEK